MSSESRRITHCLYNKYISVNTHTPDIKQKLIIIIKIICSWGLLVVTRALRRWVFGPALLPPLWHKVCLKFWVWSSMFYGLQAVWVCRGFINMCYDCWSFNFKPTLVVTGSTWWSQYCVVSLKFLTETLVWTQTDHVLSNDAAWVPPTIMFLGYGAGLDHVVLRSGSQFGVSRGKKTSVLYCF